MVVLEVVAAVLRVVSRAARVSVEGEAVARALEARALAASVVIPVGTMVAALGVEASGAVFLAE